MKKIFLLLSLLPALSQAQDTTSTQDQIFNRPFITLGKSQTAVGGYVEGNTRYFSQAGLSDGFSMELRRFNLFLFSSVGPRIRFLSELEFEHGTREISLETAMLDFRIHSLLHFRAGILLTPIGAFNQNHDSPRWEIIDRPLVSTRIIPSTLSEVGFGFNGKKVFKGGLVTWDAVVVNGLGSGLVLNAEGRTSTQLAKSPFQFEEDLNGSPMLAAKCALRSFKWGEVGLSWYGGVYNQFRREGEIVDVKRRMDLAAVDFNLSKGSITLQGEAAMNFIQVDDSIQELYGERQAGFFVECDLRLMERAVLKWQKTRLIAALRAERVDYNMGTFASTGGNIHDEVTAFTLGLSLRPTAATVLRLNMRRETGRDLVGNRLFPSTGIMAGVASYF